MKTKIGNIMSVMSPHENYVWDRRILFSFFFASILLLSSFIVHFSIGISVGFCWFRFLIRCCVAHFALFCILNGLQFICFFPFLLLLSSNFFVNIHCLAAQCGCSICLLFLLLLIYSCIDSRGIKRSHVNFIAHK